MSTNTELKSIFGNGQRLEVDVYSQHKERICISVMNDDPPIEEVVWLDLAGAEKLATALIAFIRNHPDVAPSLSSEAVTR